MLPVHEFDDLPPGELRFHRRSGRVCLDLVATVGERWHRRFERLREPQDLERWLQGAGLVDDQVVVDADGLAAARRLRGAVEELMLATLDVRAPSATAVAVVNEHAAGQVRAPQLTAGRVQHRTPPSSSAVTTALAEVARDAVELFGTPERARVRECAAEDCALVFLDSSRGRRRRWCSMQGCGNRAKVARHRAGSPAPGAGRVT